MEIELNKMSLGDAHKLKEIEHIPMKVEVSRVRDLRLCCPRCKLCKLKSWGMCLQLIPPRYDETYTLYKSGGFKGLIHSVKRQLKKAACSMRSFCRGCMS